MFVASQSVDSPALRSVLERVRRSGVRVFELAPGVLERVADTVTPQPLLATVRVPRSTIEDLVAPTFLVVCVDVRDPGNAGAVIRAADAAGADGVVCCEGTVDPFNPKTVRASAGSIFHLPVVVDGDPEDVLDALRARGVRSLAAVAHGGVPYTDVDLGSPVAIVLGNEAAGLPEHLSGHLDGEVTVPMSGRAESLNVSMAAAVLLFEVARCRSNLPVMHGAT